MSAETNGVSWKKIKEKDGTITIHSTFCPVVPIHFIYCTFSVKAPSCEVCHTVHGFLEITSVDLNLRYPDYPGQPPEHPDYHGICPSCLDETKSLLEEIKKMPTEDLPLYVGSNNIFIQNYVVKRLKNGVAPEND